MFLVSLLTETVIDGKVQRELSQSEFDDYEFTPADEESMDALLFGTNPVC